MGKSKQRTLFEIEADLKALAPSGQLQTNENLVEEIRSRITASSFLSPALGLSFAAWLLAPHMLPLIVPLVLYTWQGWLVPNEWAWQLLLCSLLAGYLLGTFSNFSWERLVISGVAGWAMARSLPVASVLLRVKYGKAFGQRAFISFIFGWISTRQLRWRVWLRELCCAIVSCALFFISRIFSRMRLFMAIRREAVAAARVARAAEAAAAADGSSEGLTFFGREFVIDTGQQQADPKAGKTDPTTSCDSSSVAS